MINQGAFEESEWQFRKPFYGRSKEKLSAIEWLETAAFPSDIINFHSPPDKRRIYSRCFHLFLCAYFTHSSAARPDKNPFKSHEPEKRKQPKEILLMEQTMVLKLLSGLLSDCAKKSLVICETRVISTHVPTQLWKQKHCSGVSCWFGNVNFLLSRVFLAIHVSRAAEVVQKRNPVNHYPLNKLNSC